MSCMKSDYLTNEMKVEKMTFEKILKIYTSID